VEIDEHITCKLEIRLDRVQTSWSLRVVRDDLAGTYLLLQLSLLAVCTISTYLLVITCARYMRERACIYV
jgi:hypothetical protein